MKGDAWGPSYLHEPDLLAARYRPIHPAMFSTYEPAVIHDLAYERYVEAPRRQGRDPMYEAMMAEALGAPAAEGAA